MVDASIFDFLKTPLKIDKPIRLIEMFAGVGSQAKALERLGANFEHYKISEWEVNATASYKAVHKGDDTTDYSAEFTADELTEILFNIGISTDGKKPLSVKEIARKGEQWKRTVYNNFKATNNIGSILNVKGADLGIVDTDQYTYILTYSFPCQDLSLAGKGKGMAKDSGTRSGLLWEVERLLNECSELPQILLMENVTQVHGSKNREHFDEWIRFLESKGYSNYWKDLNAKNFGIPQNRNRTFMVSVLGDYVYEFPQEFPLTLRLKDMLETEVDEKFYLSGKMINYFTENTKRQQEKGNGFKFQPTDGACVGKAITTRAGGRMDDNFIEEQPKLEVAFNLYNEGVKGFNRNTGEVLHTSGVCQTIQTMQGGNRQPKIVEPAINIVGNYSPSNHDASRIVDTDGIAPTVKENHGTVTGIAEPLAYDEQNGYIRKDGTVGTLTTDGSSPKHNNRVVENCYVSEKGVKFICSPKRGMTTDVNADVCQPLTANGQANWTGSFVSPDIENLEKSSTIGGTEPTKINLKNGESVYFDGKEFSSVEKTAQLIGDAENGKYPPDTAYGKFLFQSSRFEDKPLEECSQTIKSSKVDCGVITNLRIRKLTPKECWRLMGFDDADFEKAAEVNSNSQLYKQAGNSIVVDVLYYIFREML